MAKINIYIPDEMLERIDCSAQDAGISRSGLIQEAMGEYLGAQERAAIAGTRQARIEAAISAARTVAEDMPADIDAATVIRASRDATPDWLAADGGGEAE